MVRKLITAACFALCMLSISLSAQEYTELVSKPWVTNPDDAIYFKLADNGHFYREGSDKNYYVINYPGKSEQELKDLFESTLRRLALMPQYFHYPEFALSTAENIHASWRRPSFQLGAPEYTMDAKIEYKDGRVRINAPTLKIGHELTSYYPEEFLANGTWGSGKGERRAACEFAVNRMLNLVHHKVKYNPDRINPDCGEPVVIGDDLPHYFHLLGDGYYRFENGLGKMSFKFPGVDKETLKSFVEVVLGLTDDRQRSIYNLMDTPGVHLYEGGVSSVFKFEWDFPGKLGSSYHAEIDATAFYACEDEVITVFVPFIDRVIQRKPDYHFLDGPLEWLYCYGYIKNGELKKGKEKDIENLDEMLNLIVMAPIRVIQYTLDNPAKKVEDDW